MLKQLLFFGLIIISTAALAQNEPKKNWGPNNPLQWSDFQAPIDASSKYFAHIYCGSNYKYTWKQRDGKYTFTFEVTGNMTPGRSWSKVEKQTPELLKHEQTHFDIAEFFARQLLAAFNAFAYTNNFDTEIEKLKTQMNDEREAMQLVYDYQTNHSLNKDMQAKWDAYLADLLSHTYPLEAALIKEPALIK